MASRKPIPSVTITNGVLPVYSITHPPHNFSLSIIEKQKSDKAIRRVPSTTFKGRKRFCRISVSTRASTSPRNCDILRQIVDEESLQRTTIEPPDPKVTVDNESFGVHIRVSDCDGEGQGSSGEGRETQDQGIDHRSLSDMQGQASRASFMSSEVLSSDEDDQFDTDLSESEENACETSYNKKRKKETLQAYKIACLKSKRAPTSAFVSQIGQISIDLHNRLCGVHEVKPISLAMMSDQITEVLDLSSNPLGMPGSLDVGKMMARNREIQYLNLSRTELGREGLEKLVKNLVNNSSLHTLHLASNSLQGGDEAFIARIIQNIPCLKELYLGHNALGSPSITNIALALEEVTCSLKVLDLQYNCIRKEAASRLTQALAKNTSLVTVNLSWNGLGSEGCVGLARILTGNRTLRELDVSSNRICAQDAQLLTRGLWNNASLWRLRMSSNPITTEGAKALAKALLRSKSSAMRELELKAIPVDDDFVFMTKVLEEHNTTQVIYDVTGYLYPIMDITTKPWPLGGPDLGFYEPATVIFEYMKLEHWRLIDLFEFLDHQKNGKISRNDLRRGIHQMMIPFSEHNLLELMAWLDRNKDGYISFDELLQAYKLHYCSINDRKARARGVKSEDDGLTDLWQILREIIRKRRPVSEKKTTWYTFWQEKWKH